jgi:hypothetical protein
MLEIDFEKLIINIFKNDIKSNKSITKMSQLTTITIKSLLPNENRIGNSIDYKRFREELKLWKYYRISEKDNMDKIIEDKNTWDYFNYRSGSLYSRILPIIVANPDYEILEREAIKNLLYTNGDLESLWTWIFNTRVIYNLLKGKEDILEDVKDYIINFTQIEYINLYSQFYRFPLEDYPGNFKIEFEKERINFINILNGINMLKYREAIDLIGIIKGKEPETNLGEIIISSHKDRDLDIEVPKFYLNINDYIVKLRKSRIDPENLKINNYKLPDIFSFKEGELFFHSLLNDGKVIKKEVRDNLLTSLVQTRSGMYLFKRDPF